MSRGRARFDLAAEIAWLVLSTGLLVTAMVRAIQEGSSWALVTGVLLAVNSVVVVGRIVARARQLPSDDTAP